MDSRGMYDSQVQNETPSDEFVLHAKFPSLQQMAYSKIAIAVWYKYSSTPNRRRQYELLVYDYDHSSTDKIELMDCHKLIETLTMPRFMKENLIKYLKRVRKETFYCTEYFTERILSNDLLYEYGIDRTAQVDWEYFVWCPDGRINYKSTAIKMLRSGVLTEVQKFAIVCRFCLENEIESFDLNRRPMKTFVSKVCIDRDPLLFYWICYLKNELHRVTPLFLLSSNNYRMEAEAFEYLWNRLSAEDQVSLISDKLLTVSTSPWRDSLFLKMSHDQLTNLLFRRPVNMILLFLNNLEIPEWAIMAWKRCKNSISNEHFVALLHSLLGQFRYKLIRKQERKMRVLLEIWNTANDHQKNHAARQARLEEAVVRLLSVNPIRLFVRVYFASDEARLWIKLAPSCFKFLLKFLSFTSADFRKNLILRGDLSFIFHFDFHVVHEIFELCLPNSSQDEVQFETEPSNFKIRPYFCIILYTVEDQDELNERLLRSFENLNIPSKDLLQKFIESLAIAHKRVQSTRDTSDYLRLSKFINKILQENVLTVLKMKESYFSSFISATSDPYERYGSLDELSKLIEQEFVHEHLQELKHRFAKILQTTSVERWVWMVSNYEDFTRVFSWCFENEEEMFLQVKRCIPINDIIGKVLDVSKIMRRMANFSNLQRFLEWYFSVVEGETIQSFRHSIRNDPETAKIRAVEMIKEYDKDQQPCREFLRWIGHRIDLHVKRSTYGIVISFFFFLFFAILSVIYVHL